MMQHGYSYFFRPGIISLVQFRWSRDGHVLCYLVGIASINFIKEQPLLLLFKQIHFTFKMKTAASIIFLYKLWVRISRVSFGLLNGMFHPRYWILMSTPGPGWPKAWYFWCNVHWTFRSFLPQVSWTHVLISNSWQAWLGIVDQNWLKLALAKLALGQPISLKVVGMPIPVIITVRSKFPFICM